MKLLSEPNEPRIHGPVDLESVDLTDSDESRDSWCCSIEVSNETLREALSNVASRIGWQVLRNPIESSVVILDEARALVGEQHSRRSVLVVEPTPLGSHRGLQALAAGTVAAIIAEDRPTDLEPALAAVMSEWGAFPQELVRNALRLPHLTERQVAIVGAVIAGQRTKEIARALYLSDASIKRELALLFRSLGVNNRLSLAVLATELGFEPKRVHP